MSVKRYEGGQIVVTYDGQRLSGYLAGAERVTA